MSTQTYRYYCLDGVGHLHLAEWFEAENDEKAVSLIEEMHPDGRSEIWQGNRLVAKTTPVLRRSHVRIDLSCDVCRGNRFGFPEDGDEDAIVTCMSLGDWARFCVDQLAGSKGKGKLLSTASYRLMQNAQPNGPTGLDWGIQSSIAGRKGPVLVHGGSDGDWFAYAVLFPASGNGVLVIDNASQPMGGDAAAMAALKALFPSLAPAT